MGASAGVSGTSRVLTGGSIYLSMYSDVLQVLSQIHVYTSIQLLADTMK